MLRNPILAGAAFALALAPIAAEAAPIAPQTGPVARTGTSAEDADELAGRRGIGIYIIGAVVLGLIVWGIIELTSDDEEEPHSP